MKLQIDTKEKTISIVDLVNIKELVKALKGMLGDEYEKYSIVSNNSVYWYYYPTITWTSGDSVITTTTTGTAVYNVEVMNN